MVMEEGTKGYYMCFVNRGSLVVHWGQGDNRVELATLPTGSYFGMWVGVFVRNVVFDTGMARCSIC